MAEDYYSTLGVSKTASQDEIRSAYKKLAIKHHPDRNPENRPAAEEKMKKINEAYDTLKDPEKRSKYDRFGSGYQNGSGGGGFGGFGGFGFGGGSFDDIFDDLTNAFGGGRRKSSPSGVGRSGSDLRYNLKISLEESYSGAKKEITFNALGKCDDCGGKGGDEVVTCRECDGHGAIRYQQGFFIVENTCPKCGGEGKMIKNPCKKCKGAGRHEKEYKVEVDIPRGINDGDNIKMSGMGEAGLRGGRSGDLFVAIKILPNDIFERAGSDLRCEVPVTLTKAVLGGEILVPCIDGKMHKIKLDSGTQHDHIIKVSGRGMPRMNSSSFGDLLCKIKIEMPVNMPKEAVKLFEQVEQILSESSSPKTKKFVEKIKKIFS